MNDQLRESFERLFPLPDGVTWDGDHYLGRYEVVGSFTNATVWSHLWRGYKARDAEIQLESA